MKLTGNPSAYLEVVLEVAARMLEALDGAFVFFCDFSNVLAALVQVGLDARNFSWCNDGELGRVAGDRIALFLVFLGGRAQYSLSGDFGLP